MAVFVVTTLVCAEGSLAVVGLKLFRVVRLSWVAVLLISVALALASWYCLSTAAQISASV